MSDQIKYSDARFDIEVTSYRKFEPKLDIKYTVNFNLKCEGKVYKTGTVSFRIDDYYVINYGKEQPSDVFRLYCISGVSNFVERQIFELMDCSPFTKYEVLKPYQT